MSDDEDAVRLPRYQVGIDSYRVATSLMDQYGDGAKAYASRRMQEMLDLAYEVGAAAWLDILLAIEEVRRGPLPGEVTN